MRAHTHEPSAKVTRKRAELGGVGLDRVGVRQVIEVEEFALPYPRERELVVFRNQRNDVAHSRVHAGSALFWLGLAAVCEGLSKQRPESCLCHGCQGTLVSARRRS